MLFWVRKMREFLRCEVVFIKKWFLRLHVVLGKEDEMISEISGCLDKHDELFSEK
jgi:hypothetical protein